MTRSRASLVAVLLAPLLACTSLGSYVWVDDYKRPPAANEDGYVIAPGDVLNVRVYNQEGMSARVKVRPDGKASLPFLNDVELAGEPPASVAARLQTRLKEFINTPVVTVSLEELARLNVPVVGEVARPGVYPVDPGSGVLQLIALAGGLTDYAHKDRVFVLRSAPERARVRFTFQALAHADGQAALFHLRDGDTVVVE